IAVEASRFAVEAVPETLRVTTLGGGREGTSVNPERSLRLGDRLRGGLGEGPRGRGGGTGAGGGGGGGARGGRPRPGSSRRGGVGDVRAVRAEGDGTRVTLAIPDSLRRFVASKGSVAVDGVSLTVAGLTDSGCEIAYIPHTLAATSAGRYAPGTRVNLEVDLLARYLARLRELPGED